MKHRIAWGMPFVMMIAASVAWSRGREDDEDAVPKTFKAPIRMRMAAPAAEMMGVTPGGAQDIGYARDRIRDGEVPHPNTFTPEGLFSEHDLPLDTGRPCKQTICVTAAAAPADLIAQPEVRTMAQIGFASNLDPKTWRRAPLNLIAVVDKSGSMSGAPLAMVRSSLHTVVDQLGERDQLAIVLYGDTTHVHLPPTRLGQRKAIHRAIDAISSAGSTYMEAGLKLGYQVAAETAPKFRGTTRLMLFTDERPNVGRTDAGSFMALARNGSRRGIGLTTIGVGTHFGAELATKISSVRGGNLFFFPDLDAMQNRFRRDLDTMVTELAYDLKLTVRPANGHALVGLYGVPGDAVKRTPGGGLEMTVETVFLSRERGGIFVALAPAGGGALPPGPGPVAEVSLTYEGVDGRRYADRLDVELWAGPSLPLGLARGRLLVDEVTTLKKAAALHLHENDQEGAWRLVRALRQRFEQAAIPGLEGENALIAKLDETLTRLSGHQGEPGASVARRDPVTGLPH